MVTSLKSFLKKEEQEDLHRFRVQVKKLRAFIILSDSMKHHPNLKIHFKPVRKIFKEAGVIRDAYNNLELAKIQHTEEHDFSTGQRNLMQNATMAFKKKGDSYLKEIKSALDPLRQKIKAINDIHIILFYENQLQQISEILAVLKFGDELHECRKLVKILIYNFKLVHTSLVGGFNEEYLQQVQTEIGDWHDNVLAVKLFSDEAVKDKTAVARLKTEQVKLKKNVTILVEDFYNRATTVTQLPVEQLS